jgi:predicted transcriptional regulator
MTILARPTLGVGDSSAPPVPVRDDERTARAPEPVRQHAGAPGWTGTRYGRAALNGLSDELEQAPGGHRHQTLYAAALRAGSLVAGGELDELAAQTTLVALGRTVGLTHRDAERQVSRGMAQGALRPAVAGPSPAIWSAGDARATVVEWWNSVMADEQLRTATGATVVRILAGFGLAAMAAGTTRVNESYRELAELSGVGIGTIHRRLPELARFVRRTHRGRRNSTVDRSSWQLVTGRAERNTQDALPTGYAGVFHPARGLQNPSSPWWQRWSTGWRLFCELDADDGLTAAELATRTGLHVTSVRRNLRRMEQNGWTHRDELGRWRCTPETVETEPEYDGIRNHRELRRQRFRTERELRREALAARARERERRRERRHEQDEQNGRSAA